MATSTPISQSDPRAAWRTASACQDYPTELFFPQRGSDRRSTEHSASIARSICALCPVRLACLTFALGCDTEAVTGEPQSEAALHRPSQLAGIWGGTNEVERRTLRRQIRSGRSVADVVASAPVPSADRHPSLRATAC